MIDEILDAIYQHYAKTQGESELLHHFVQGARYKVRELSHLLGDAWEGVFK
tara:strand:+ start:1167 stop:1319 length:153 start_codon:yes stop_codon:yes gene_type:complete